MAAADLGAWLVEATLAGSAALLVVLALRGPLRRVFGAGAAYAAWSALPVVLVATLLPAMPMPVPSLPMSVMQAPIAMLAETTPSRATPDIAALACLLWMAGCTVFAACFAWQQRRFLRGLGRIATRGDGIWLADATAGLPAVVGVLRPRIVMPADALSRYDATERRLMLAHEREHIRHGDLLANAVVVALRCVFWFNPLLHVAARRFRDDQELACDARVIAGHPRQRRAYGEAMFKTQLATQRLPLGCHWGQSHPLKERIEMLKQPTPSSLRRNSGRALVIAILLASGYTAWAAQPAQPSISTVPAGKIATEIALRVDEGDPVPLRAVADPGVPFTMDARHDGRHFAIASTVQRTQLDGKPVLRMQMRITEDGKLLTEPGIAVESGKSAQIHVGEVVAGAAGRTTFKGVRLDIVLTDSMPTASRAAKPMPAQASASTRKQTPIASTMDGTGTYERMLTSLSASWMPPKPPQDEC